jgi:hypothetical protein
MEQPCYKCGQLLEEGRVFCPHCAAPQIRVVIAEPVAAAATGGDAAVTTQASTALPASETVPVLAVPVGWSKAFKPCALAAVVASLLMSLGLTPAVAMFSVGFLAVVFYRQGRPGMVIKPSTGARLGAFGGLLWFGITAVLGALAATVPEMRTKMREQITENIQKSAASHPADPRIQAVVDQMKTPEGFAVMLILFGILLLVVCIVLGILGGALGGAIFGRREQG